MNRILKNIPMSLAYKTVIGINFMAIVFHLLVLFKIIPYDQVWGGRLKTEKEMYVFEAVSILINLILIATVMIKFRVIRLGVRKMILNAILWLFAGIFALNTIGNIAAESKLEMLIATPLTFVLAILCWRLAVEQQPASGSLTA